MNVTLHCSPPPTGFPFLASGNIILREEFSTSAEPFCGLVRFSKDGELVWDRSGMSVRMYWEAEIHIHGWRPSPMQIGWAVPFMRVSEHSPESRHDSGYSDYD